MKSFRVAGNAYKSPAGIQQIPLNLTRGSFFGEVAIVTESPYNSTMTAKGKKIFILFLFVSNHFFHYRTFYIISYFKSSFSSCL